MSVGLYMDVHVPFSITRGLRRRGVEVITAQDDGTTRVADPELIDRAMAMGRMLFSQDEDMLVEAVQRQRLSQPCATIIFAAQMDCSVGRCVADLEALAKAATIEDTLGQIIYL
jgi:predicted nuclease of predicted toxin-antitoxin system